MKLLSVSLTLVLSITAFAQQRHGCSQGAGAYSQQLAGGFTARVSPATDDAHAGQCRAAISSSEGKNVFEIFDREIDLNRISGADVNGDGKPDAVIETHPPAKQCCWNYYIVSLGDQPGLAHEFSTSVPLNFEDKLGDGKVEIWTRDFAFDGLDNIPHSESPAPLMFFRLKGNTVYNVGQLFWTDFEREISETRGYISKQDIDDLTKQEGENPKPPQEGDPKEAHLRSARAQVLTLIVDYLYAGKGEQAWKTISEMWPLLDRQRIRQLILRQRMQGVMSEINRPPKQSAQAAPTSATVK